MKVVLFMVGLEPGGGSMYVIRLAEELIKQQMEVKVISLRCLDGTRAVIGDKEIPWECLGMRNLYDLSVIGPIISKLRQFRPQLVHTNHPADAMLGNLAARVLGVPCITTVQSPLDQIRYSKTNVLSGNLAYQRYLWAERLACRFANKTIAVSNLIREELIEKHICSPSKVTTIHYGVDLELFNPGRFPVSSSDTLTVGCVARISAEKGIQYFIEAAIRLSEHWPNVRFDLVGGVRNRAEQLYFEKCLKILDSSGKRSLFRFLGHKTDIPSLLSQMDVVVVPSLSEGLPLAVIEAIAMGKPLVASNVDGIPEIVANGETSLLVEPGNANAIAIAIEQLLRDESLRTEMGRKARLRAEEAFSQKRMIEQTLQCYESI